MTATAKKADKNGIALESRKSLPSPSSATDDTLLLGFPPVSQPQPMFVRRKYDPQRAFQDKQRRLYGMLRNDSEFGGSASADSNDDGGAQRKLLPPPIPRSFVISDSRNCNGSASDFDYNHDIGESSYDSDSDIDVDICGDCDYGGDGYAFDDYNEKIVTDGEYLLYNRARDLEEFISDPEETTRLAHRQRAAQLRRQKVRRRVRRGFFNIPGEVETVRYKTDEESSSDWVVVSIELERSKSCDSLLDENLINLIQDATKNDPPPKVAEDTANVESSAVASNALPSIDEDYGLIHARNRHLRRLLRLFRFLDFDIRFGKPLSEEQKRALARKPSLNSLITAGISRAKFERRRRRREVRVWKTKAQVDDQPQPCCSTTMDVKTDRMAETLFTNGPTDEQRLPSVDEKSSSFCIAKYFGLNDDGDIIIHLDHIVEHKGYGFLMRRKQRIYRRIGFGNEIDEYEKVPFTLRSMIRNYVKTLQARRGELATDFCFFLRIRIFRDDLVDVFSSFAFAASLDLVLIPAVHSLVIGRHRRKL